MDNQSLFERYRVHFSRAIALAIVVASGIEIIAYFVLARAGACALSFTDPYLLHKVLLPIGLNIAICVAVMAINHASKITYKAKNGVIIHGASAIAFVIAMIHREFVVNTSACLFPMILSAAFNDKKLISRTFVFSLVTITVTVICSALDGGIDLINHINYIVMYGFLIVGYFACSLSEKYSQLYLRLIKQQARDNAQLQDTLLRDSMTGLYNHRTFHMELTAAISAYQEKGRAFCLAMIDIDHFKQVNDRYGHDGGDEVLHKLATILKQFCQPEDKAFRYGGEEFAVLFSAKTMEESLQLLQKMHETFSKTKYTFTEDIITFSAGIAGYCGDQSKAVFFDRADDLLYKAKENGRNQIRTDAETNVTV